ncbi:ATP-dependent Clp protease adapter protein ClpS [Nitrospira sp. KM1]|uniref:ATP-dependent Clp protease adaptor ClpS n=1 Tax=Nitrospira sp. KM1 TaxID=1936990 RepID=UPI0013A782E6|nr:ATP-dependent Clp protease adaptor ClpS [Nitrospira sp. KM1]BCA53296.1 ATP-dependent Clp protease adapter protein ClpS [Nitrospira sp. KM1]
MAESPSPVAVPVETEVPSTGAGDGLDARVIVYNCDCHTYQQVIALFCACIPGMNPSKAFELAWKIDHDGEAVVFTGGVKQAEEIAGKLGGGGLRVAVQ